MIWLGVVQADAPRSLWQRIVGRLRREEGSTSRSVLDAIDRVRALEARVERFEASRLARYRDETRTAVRALKDT